jgi:hypothetical protein
MLRDHEIVVRGGARQLFTIHDEAPPVALTARIAPNVQCGTKRVATIFKPLPVLVSQFGLVALARGDVE